MAIDVKIVKGLKPTVTYGVAAGAVGSITPGKPVKVSGNDVVLLATGDPEIGTDEMVGIAASTSTETATADGTVEVYPIDEDTVMRCKVTTPANMDTQAELDGLKNDWVTFDLTGSTFTVDEDEGSDPNVHGLKIIDGDIEAGTVDFTLHRNASTAAPLTGQTMD